jgi:hypothetical protein
MNLPPIPAIVTPTDLPDLNGELPPPEDPNGGREIVQYSSEEIEEFVEILVKGM